MSKDHPRGTTRDVIHLADVRRRRESEKEDVVAPIRQAFMEELGELLAEYLEAIDEATDSDPEKATEELMAACSTVLALTAEDHFEDAEDQIEFIEAVAEIAADLIVEDSAQGELFEDDDEPR